MGKICCQLDVKCVEAELDCVADGGSI